MRSCSERLLPPLSGRCHRTSSRGRRRVLPTDVDAAKRRAHLVEQALDLRLDREVGPDLGAAGSPERARARFLAAFACTTSRAPSAASARAHAEPIPPEPPVISTPFP